MSKNYTTLTADAKVESIEFVGGGVAVVTLKSGFGNINHSNYHSANQSFTAWCHRVAQEFVDGATASNYGTYPGGGAGRVEAGTPRSCNPQSELYWSM